MKDWLLNNIVNITALSCTAHGSLYAFFANWVRSKVGREEFEARFSSLEKSIAEMHGDIASQSGQHLQIAAQIGELGATVRALKDSSDRGDENLKELFREIRLRP